LEKGTIKGEKNERGKPTEPRFLLLGGRPILKVITLPLDKQREEEGLGGKFP